MNISNLNANGTVVCATFMNILLDNKYAFGRGFAQSYVNCGVVALVFAFLLPLGVLHWAE